MWPSRCGLGPGVKVWLGAVATRPDQSFLLILQNLVYGHLNLLTKAQWERFYAHCCSLFTCTWPTVIGSTEQLILQLSLSDIIVKVCLDKISEYIHKLAIYQTTDQVYLHFFWAQSQSCREGKSRRDFPVEAHPLLSDGQLPSEASGSFSCCLEIPSVPTADSMPCRL